MPRINGNGKINVPTDIVKRMGGLPGDEIVFIEELDPGDNILKKSRTYKLAIMLRSVWDEEMKRASEENGDKLINSEEPFLQGRKYGSEEDNPYEGS